MGKVDLSVETIFISIDRENVGWKFFSIENRRNADEKRGEQRSVSYHHRPTITKLAHSSNHSSFPTIVVSIKINYPRLPALLLSIWPRIFLQIIAKSVASFSLRRALV